MIAIISGSSGRVPDFIQVESFLRSNTHSIMYFRFIYVAANGSVSYFFEFMFSAVLKFILIN